MAGRRDYLGMLTDNSLGILSLIISRLFPLEFVIDKRASREELTGSECVGMFISGILGRSSLDFYRISYLDMVGTGRG